MSNENAFSLVLTTFLPAAAALLVLLGESQGRDRLSRWYALGGTVLTFLISLSFLGGMAEKPGEYTARVDIPWISDAGIHFILGLDGLSGAMVFLTNLLAIVAVLASWTAVEKRRKEFYAFLLTLQTGILGTFLALDLFLFYVFWEIMLVPLYFLIGIFGSGNRVYATMKFFLFTMAGSVLMLAGILALYFRAGELLPGGPTFALADLLTVSGKLPAGTQWWIFLSFLFAFCIKVPLFPLHTWLPDAHTEAPTAGSILLAGVLLKTGVYGLMRFAIPLFPAAALEFAPLVLTLSVVAIIYGALTAMAQDDMKRLVAYSSVSHMGFIALGLFAFTPESVSGAALQMVNHGISTGALFLCVGILYERRHTRRLADFGGLAGRMKIYTVMTVIAVLSSAGLPGLNGFTGEFLIMLGTFARHPMAAAIASLGVILAAVYLLRMVQAVFFGPEKHEENRTLRDVNLREFAALGLLLFYAFSLGIKPGPWLRLFEPAAAKLAAIAPAVEAPAKVAKAETAHDGGAAPSPGNGAPAAH